MRKQWVTIAPNGVSVTLNMGGPFDRSYKHNKIIHDEKIAIMFPSIFIESGATSVLQESYPKGPAPVPVPESKPEILKEIPRRDEFGAVKEEPVVKEPELLNEINLQEVSPSVIKSENVVEVPNKKKRGRPKKY